MGLRRLDRGNAAIGQLLRGHHVIGGSHGTRLGSIGANHAFEAVITSFPPIKDRSSPSLHDPVPLKPQ